MRKDIDAGYRLGLYGQGIERIKLKKALHMIEKASSQQAEIVDIGHDNFDSVCEAFLLGMVDMAAVDMVQLMQKEKDGEDLPYGVVISGVLKRSDSRYVMVRRKHTKNLVENAVVVTDSYDRLERIKHLYEGISCVVEPDIRKCFEMLEAKECDAVFTLLEDVRAARLYNSFRYRYTIMDCGECIPEHGEGVYAILTRGKKEAVRTAKKLSHKTTAVCFEIEDDIINRVSQNVYVRSCDVYARISSDKLEIYADVTGSRGRIRVNEKGSLGNKNLIITKVVDRINRNM